MNQPGWPARDPDLGRERATKALGRRDWNYFSAYHGATAAPADVEPAASPWAGHRFTAKDRHDRTLGIPGRQVCMWPGHHPTLHTPTSSSRAPADTAGARRMRADQVIADLRTVPGPPSPAGVSPPALAELLTEIAPRIHGRSPTRQHIAVCEVARRHQIPPGALLTLARDAGTLIAKTTHRPAPSLLGEATLNRLLGAELSLASEVLLARARLGFAAAHSDPDLPRLWILANGLHHGVPAHVLLTEPAHSRGPLARIQPRHDDLVGWHGIPAALDQLQATVHAAGQGRAWLSADLSDTAGNRLLALGVIHLSHPRTAYELTRAGAATIGLADLRHLLHHLPEVVHVTDLGDAALKAVCDRNNWLLGTPDERTSRELVERHLPGTVTDEIRAGLAAGDTRALTEAIGRVAPADHDLDQATWRREPPAPEATQRRQLLDVASREALHRFAGLAIEPHPSKAAAIAARFPGRIADHSLAVRTDQLFQQESADATVPPAHPAQQIELDLGL